MTNTTLSRRRLVQGAAAALALGAVPGIALANADSLLADILIGVGDAMKRDYIREHYGRGRWDGHYWHYEGRRYTPTQYRDFWLSRYEPPAPRPQPRPAPGPNRNPPPCGNGPCGPAILPAAVPVVRATAEGGPATKVADPDPAVTVPAEARVMIAAPVAPDLVKPPI